jgi:PRC-barrel domain
MLRHAHDLVGVHVGAADGDVGHLHDLYFDDQQWAIRYLVVDTGHWFHHRRVLIAPTDVSQVDWSGRWVDLMLTQGQVRSEPGADTDTPATHPSPRRSSRGCGRGRGARW